MNFPENLNQKLEKRIASNTFRTLKNETDLIDFSSNDYLGFAQSKEIFDQVHKFLIENKIYQNGATGSRLLSGNHRLYDLAETQIAYFHNTESALIFNSGYDANVGFFSAVPQRNDLIFYDELCHASIRDGIQLSQAKAFKYAHNDFESLENMLQKFPETKNIYVVTESVFSMDGDGPSFAHFKEITQKYNLKWIIDEAHAVGVFGSKGVGMIQQLELENYVFARIATFGKAIGCHGAAILGSEKLKNYLINFARSFIYTTGLSPHSVTTIIVAYRYLNTNDNLCESLIENIKYFNQIKKILGLTPMFVRSKSAIQSAIIPSKKILSNLSNELKANNFDVRPIFAPTVPEGHERLRICLHVYNSKKEIEDVLNILSEHNNFK